jgi:hypothetical protein
MAPPARLTDVLLARKGHALPTGGFAHAKLDLIPPQATATKLDLQPWAAPAPRGVLLKHPQPVREEPRRRSGDADDGRVAFTVRLDRDRHARLRILAARRARSGQEMLIKALDAYLEACATDCPCLRRGSVRSADK